MRIYVLAVAALILVGTIPGLIGLVRASDGLLNPPHSDYAVDTDLPPNGLYDELIVNISVDVTVAGMFVVIVDLYDNTGAFWIDDQFLTPNLAFGVQTVQLSFAGYVIRSSGHNGPYQVDIVLLDDTFMFLDMGTHMTGAYNAVDFENPPGYFNPPHSDWALDADGDSLFDFMIVDTNLVINASGDYSVQGTLFDNSGMWFIEWQDNMSFLSPGPLTVDLAFTGYVIRSSGFDGPYRVELYLYDNFMNLLHNDTYFTNPYLATDFSYPPALFDPPHNDYGLDTNGNGTYEFLVVEASLNVSVDGTYRVEGNAPFGWTQNETFLNAGYHMVELMFYGFEIFNSGMDGPYMINLNILDEFWNLLDSDVHTTGPYQFTDFEAYPPINFNPPYWDYGLDTDGDSDFNYLVVNINLTVDVAGTYEVMADLWDFGGMTWITTQTNLTWVDMGNQTVDISFIGGDIYDSGIDGPYYVTFQLMDDMGWWFGSDDYYTNPYLFTDFDLPSAFFNPPHSDYGLDICMPADGIFEFLIVNASIFANDPGQYLIQAIMFDPMFQPFLMVQQSANLSAGPGIVPLYFSGIEINRHGMDGPFFVMMYLFEFGPTGGSPAPIDDDIHITGMYSYTDFLSLPVSKVWGYVYDAASGSPLINADIALANYSYKWMMQTMTDPSGYYEVDAFDGDIIVVADDDDLQSELSLEAIVGDTEVTRWLDPTPPGEMVSDIAFADWDNAHADVVGTMPEDNQSMRFMIDIMIGNMDGYVNQSEADSFLALFMSGNGPSQMFTSTEDHLLCDGIYYDFVPGTDSMVFDVVGPVTSPNPMTMNLAADYTSNTTIPVSSIHRVQINNTYDDDSEIGSTSGQFPAGFNLWGYDPVQNVTVGGIGMPFFDVDPLMDPDSADGIDYVWVNMTVGQGVPDTDSPDVMNVRINGQPAQTYDISNLPPVIFLNATIDDSSTGNVQIGGANFTEGPQNWALSTPMLPIDGSFDSPTEDVTGTIVAPPYGMTLYCVYGWDFVPNHNTVGACASLTIVDDLGPEIGNVLIDGAPTQTYFLSSAPPTAPLTATVDESFTGTSDIGGANYTTPLVDSWPGIMMNAVDGFFDGPTEDITADVPVPTVAGTYDYFVHAWDASSNYNSTSIPVQITILDDVEPAVTNVDLNGLPAISVMPGTPVTVEAIVDDTGGRGDSPVDGANYTIDGDWLTSTPMNPTDGGFDEVSEAATTAPGSIDTTGWPDAVYQICVYGWDNVPNNNVVGACAQLTVQSVPPDTTPPNISNVQVDPDPAGPGDDVRISADVSDDVALSEVIIEVRDPSGTAVTNVTMSYDAVNSEYYLTDSYNTEGSYSFTIWATDTSGNSATETGSFEIVEQDPPIIDVTVSNDDPTVGETITFEADVTDDSDIDDVRITIVDPKGTTVANNRPMTLDNGVYVYEYEFAMAGEHTYTITANDEHGNSDDVSGTITASEVAGSFFDQYWWLILVIVIIVVVLLLVAFMLRKPKPEGFAPEPGMEAPPSEEPVEPPTEELVEEPPSEDVVEEPPPPDELVENELLDDLED